jgi:PilZ domain
LKDAVLGLLSQDQSGNENQGEHREGGATDRLSANRGENRVSDPERRKIARLHLKVPVRFQVPGSNIADVAETRNVSARGLYFQTRADVQAGQELECVLILPERLTHAPGQMLVSCRGKVLRVTENRPGDEWGVALEIFGYDFSWPGGMRGTE